MERTPYLSDLTDEQWSLIEPHIPPPRPGGRPREAEMREVINGILYLNRTGCQWRALPHDLPPWGTVAYYFYAFRRDGTWQRLHDTLRQDVRVAAGREPTPSAACIDSQSVKATEKRGPAAGTTRARKSMAASGTSWSTRWG
jgi:transposase